MLFVAGISLNKMSILVEEIVVALSVLSLLYAPLLQRSRALQHSLYFVFFNVLFKVAYRIAVSVLTCK